MTFRCFLLAMFILSGCNGNNGSSDGGTYCWLVTYDLTGSTYFIDAMVDFTVTVQEPYDENLNMGPGMITLRFPDDEDKPGPGSVDMIEYSLRQNFVTGIAMAEVTTDIQTSSGPDHSGIAFGKLEAGTLTWAPAMMMPYFRDGQVSCTGSLCGTSGSPPEGDPIIFDNDYSETLPLKPFVFTNGVSNFTMEAVVLSQDSNQTTSLSLTGTETDRIRRDFSYIF